MPFSGAAFLFALLSFAVSALGEPPSHGDGTQPPRSTFQLEAPETYIDRALQHFERADPKKGALFRDLLFRKDRQRAPLRYLLPSEIEALIQFEREQYLGLDPMHRRFWNMTGTRECLSLFLSIAYVRHTIGKPGSPTAFNPDGSQRPGLPGRESFTQLLLRAGDLRRVDHGEHGSAGALYEWMPDTRREVLPRAELLRRFKRLGELIDQAGTEMAREKQMRVRDGNLIDGARLRIESLTEERMYIAMALQEDNPERKRDAYPRFDRDIRYGEWAVETTKEGLRARDLAEQGALRTKYAEFLDSEEAKLQIEKATATAWSSFLASLPQERRSIAGSYFQTRTVLTESSDGTLHIGVLVEGKPALRALQREQAREAASYEWHPDGPSSYHRAHYSTPDNPKQEFLQFAAFGDTKPEKLRTVERERIGLIPAADVEFTIVTVFTAGATLWSQGFVKGGAALLQTAGAGAAYDFLSQGVEWAQGDRDEIDFGRVAQSGVTAVILRPISATKTAQVLFGVYSAYRAGDEALKGRPVGALFQAGVAVVSLQGPVRDALPKGTGAAEPSAASAPAAAPKRVAGTESLRIAKPYVPGPRVSDATLQKAAKPVTSPSSPYPLTKTDTVWRGVRTEDIPGILENYLGKDYVRVGDRQIFRSIDGQRQVRMLHEDVTGTDQKIGGAGVDVEWGHLHLEKLTITPEGSVKVKFNLHVPIIQ